MMDGGRSQVGDFLSCKVGLPALHPTPGGVAD
jgi:hypothetical protein